jgi:predicted transcriptional regulator of viral defense system
MLYLLRRYKRPNDKINELVKNGILTTLKKGLYIPGPKLNIQTPEPFLIANHLWGPSYVSLESALSYWGFIPERVYEISSVTIKNTKTYNTGIGRFTYQHVSSPYYSFGIRSVSLKPKQVALIASPEKAVFDKVVLTAGVSLRSTKQTLAFLVDDIRMDEEKLRELNVDEMTTWIEDAQKSTSLQMLIKTLQSL